MKTRWQLCAALAIGLGLACSASSGEGDEIPGGSGGAAASPGHGGAGGMTGTGGSGGVIATDGGPDAALSPSCQFVDILFLIDSSPSMSAYQKKLASVWPQFVDAMYANLPPNVDLHVGITTTSFDTSGSTGEGGDTNTCLSGESDAYLKTKFTEPGAQSGNVNGGQGRLYTFDGKTFFAANTSTTDAALLKDWFSGAATAVGEHNSAVEFHTAGVAYVADPANATANAGFIRDKGAVLLIVFLADEPDKSYVMGTGQQFHDKFMALKKGCGNQCVLTAGIVEPCNMDVTKKQHVLGDFMRSFSDPNPPFVPIGGAATEYANVIGQQLATVIGKTCNEIGPPK